MNQPQPAALFAQERRLTSRLLQYWQYLCDGRLMPDEKEIEPTALGDHWQRCFMIQVADITDRSNYNFTYLGEDIIRAYNDGVITDDTNMLVSPNAEKLALSFHTVISTASPVVSEGEFQSLAGRMIRYRQCLLPLGQGEKVEAIFGGMGFKAY
jgi:hypothetical protein